MVKKLRDRRDQYYNLAKQSGYRSRAAFKLLQLDSKLGFLSSARCVVDLCAAPGGWLQAAAERIPGGSMIIGVDLVPIRPIRGTITLQGDITTPECKAAIMREMTGWLADVVLHDGAPNVGGNWPREAFDQNCLVLSALKLACSVLKKGGHFVTKIFRSQDYTALLGVFKKMFSKVQATKPAASRSESAEIFVVCMNYQPLKGDEAADLFDAQKVFAATSAPIHSMKPLVSKGGDAAASAVMKEWKRKRREGYEENTAGTIAYGGLSGLNFVMCEDGNHAKMIAESGCIILDDPRIANHPMTTAEIKESCQDVRVLGKRELKLLLAWRRKMQKMIKREERPVSEEPKVDEAVEEEEEDEEERAQKQIDLLKKEEEHRKKKREKKTRESKIASQKRMTAAPDAAKFKSVHDLLLEEEGGANELFSLKHLRSVDDLKSTVDAEPMELASEEEENESDEDKPARRRRRTVAYDRDGDREYDEDELVGKTPDEDSERKSKKKEKKGKKAKKIADEELPISDNEDVDVGECPLQAEIEPASEKERRHINQWKEQVSGLIKDKKNKDFDSEDSDDSDASMEDWELEAMSKIKGLDKKDSKQEAKGKKQIKQEKQRKRKQQEESSSESDSSDEDVDLDPVALALGSKLIASGKSRRELIEKGYNRYAFGTLEEKEALPGWFLEDEKQHCQAQMPVTKNDIQMYKDRMRALDARPIQKVAEARARKKRRMMGKIEAARKEAEKLAENEAMTDAEKQHAMKRVYRSARSATRTSCKVQLVISKGKATGKRTARPPGVKGRYKVVDSRMKKDLRAQKNASKRKRR